MTVRAQRKYAHKAYIPGQPYKSDAEPPELEQPTPPQATVMKTRKHVDDFLDQVTYKNIHQHKEDERIKDVRVVLKRLSPERDELLAVRRGPLAEENIQDVPENNNSLLIIRPKKTRKPIKTRRPPITKRKVIHKPTLTNNNVRQMKLRNRTVSVKYLQKKTK